jgi:hypothetical protein
MTDPALAVSVPGRGRLYKDPRDGALVVSVTNVQDVLAKPWLGGWAAKMVAGEAYDQRAALSQLDDRDQAIDMLKGAPYRKRNAAAGVGDVIHAYAASLHTDEPAPDIGPEHEPFIEALLEFIEEYEPEFTITEGTVFSPIEPERLRYAGTFDWLGTIDGYPVLADWKTGASVYNEVALQMAALQRGEVVWDRETGELLPMPSVSGCIAVHVRPKKFAVHVIDTNELAFQAFLGLRATWPWTKDQTNAVGPRMNKVRLVKELSSTGTPVGPQQDASATGSGSPVGVRGAVDDDSPAPSEESNPSSNAGVRPAGVKANDADRGGTDGPATQEGRADDGTVPADSPSPPRDTGTAGAGDPQEVLGGV